MSRWKNNILLFMNATLHLIYILFKTMAVYKLHTLITFSKSKFLRNLFTATTSQPTTASTTAADSTQGKRKKRLYVSGIQ